MSVASDLGCGRAARRPPAPRDVPLRLRAAVKRFGDTVALAGVDLDVPAGSVVGLVGPNGSGKTTLLHAAAGLIRLDCGAVSVAGCDGGSIAARAAATLVPDEPTGLDELTIDELVALVRGLWPPDTRAEERAEVLLDAFGLEARRTTRLGALSRGLRRQASAVAALSISAPLVLVDEATATLDPEAVVVLGEAVQRLADAGRGVLLATQDLTFAASTCDEVVLLHRGAVLDRGEPTTLVARHGATSLEDVLLSALGDRLVRERIRRAFRAL